MSNRSATDTIKGYFYQFDNSIEQLLNLSNNEDEITVEGIEDIDIETSNETIAIQCKYYSKTEYNHSAISKPIRLMLQHFKELKDKSEPQIKYHLYGHYKSGQDKLSLPINISFLKDKFLTYTSNKKKEEEHINLGLSDTDLQEFLDLLTVNIEAKSYEDQFNNILSLLMNNFSCDKFEAEYYYYNNALNEIRKIAIQNDISDKQITKETFLNNINNKLVLFNKWFIELKSKKKYHRELKDKYFRTLNKSPFERFFIIDLPTTYSIAELKDLVFIISKRYSNIKKREPKTYCPYIYFNNLTTDELVDLKRQLYTEGFIFIDGIPFEGADFSVEEISRKADYNNGIKAKILKRRTEITNTGVISANPSVTLSSICSHEI